MDITITPKRLSGSVKAVASKSYAHRILIAAALCDSPTKINIDTTSEDIEATKTCIKALGVKIEEGPGFITVIPKKKGNIIKSCVLDCNESGSTARFLLPVAAVLCESFSMTGKGRLPERPFTPLISQMTEKGVNISSDTLPLSSQGVMSGGTFKMPGDVSSQYISGLLFALGLCTCESKIILTSPLESAAYVDMTIDVLLKFGVKIKKTEFGFEIQPSKFKSPGEITVEGDWSNAAFWVVLGKICPDVKVTGLNYDSIQGDKKILDVLCDDIIDASQIPDLVPILCVNACIKNSKTVIKNAHRLRLKESDRLRAITNCLSSLGADIKELPDGLIIKGKGKLSGGICDGFNDHRIVMSAAIASALSENPVTIKGTEAVNKSYPTFFEDFKSLGGCFKTE